MNADSTKRRNGIPVASSKITPRHLERLAVVYVRQSHPIQIVKNPKPTRVQYSLTDHAVALGWPRERVIVIDEDQAHTAATSAGRLGFQRLVAEVGLGHVGIIVGFQMSRLARSCSLPPDMVVVDRGDVSRAKPEPDLFLACQRRLGVAVEDCYVIGDAVWDLLAARRAHMFGVGLLSGGYGQDELLEAGAYRVYRDAAELEASLDELGVLP